MKNWHTGTNSHSVRSRDAPIT